MNTNSSEHSKWNCKYHIVFAPKYRRQIIYEKIKSDIGTILRKLCDQKGVEIIEAYEQLQNSWIIEMAELSGTRKAEVDIYKIDI